MQTKLKNKKINRIGFLAGLLLLLALLLGACSDDAPQATATPTIQQTTALELPTAATTASANSVPFTTLTVPDSTRQSLDKVYQDVVAVRGLQFKNKVPINFITRDEAGRYLLAKFKQDNPPEQIRNTEKIYEIFGFVKPGFDYTASYNKLVKQQSLGFYQPETASLFVITDDPNKGANPLAKYTSEHELTHALQDQNYNLQKMLPSRKPSDKAWNDDRDLGIQALVEGDAYESQYLWLTGKYLSSNDISQVLKDSQSSDNSIFSEVPQIVIGSIYFAAQDGYAFVQRLYKQGGWAAVNKAWREYPPVSTSQILHFEKYQNRVEPVRVDLPDLTETLGAGWSSIDTNTLGEYQTRVWLKGQLSDDQAKKGAEGWAGDRYQVLEKDGKMGFAWRSAWDSENEATEFLNNAASYIPATYGVQGNGGNGQRRIWQNDDRDIQLIQKGKEVLLMVMPKGDAATRITAKLGF